MSEDMLKLPEKGLKLREIHPDDLPIFYEHQLDPIANDMAAFTAEDPADRQAFAAHWDKITNDPTILSRTILFDDQVVGSILSFELLGEREVSYWLGRAFWGQGLATRALLTFLKVADVRPLYGRAAKDNIGSIRVLQKCGFSIVDEGRGYANARGEQIEEYVLRLD